MYYTCTIIKNEHRYLREWINHCLSIGFDEIHLYEDEGSDSHASITDAYQQVHLHSITEVSRTDYQGKDWKQVDLAQYFIKTLSPTLSLKERGSSWCAFIDPDEYIRFEEGYTLQRLCEEFSGYRGIYLQFKIYGANGHIERPEGGVVENYGEGEPMPYLKWKNNMKSLVNLSYADHVWSSVHKIQCGVWTDGKQRRKNSYEHPEHDLCYGKAWIDHYYTKSWHDWVERFAKRGDIVPGNVKLQEFCDYNPDLAGKCHIPDGDLVFDIGCNNGDDSDKYLNLMCNVVAVECAPRMCKHLRERFKDEPRFTLEEVCISEKDDEEVTFYVSEHDTWSSTHREIAERKSAATEIRVKTATMQSLFDKHGIPRYCKIDIEGNDIVALRSMRSRPEYVSCETECVGNGGCENPFEVIDQLHEMGYTQFKLVCQNDGTVYANGDSRPSKAVLPWNMQLGWDDYATCRAMLAELREKHTFNTAYDFWYDVYAKW